MIKPALFWPQINRPGIGHAASADFSVLSQSFCNAGDKSQTTLTELQTGTSSNCVLIILVGSVAKSLASWHTDHLLTNRKLPWLSPRISGGGTRILSLLCLYLLGNFEKGKEKGESCYCMVDPCNMHFRGLELLGMQTSTGYSRQVTMTISQSGLSCFLGPVIA